MRELRDDLADTASEAHFYLDADTAIRGADRRRRAFRMTVVPVIAALAVLAPVTYVGLHQTASPAPVAEAPPPEPGTFASLGADVLGGDALHTADGRVYPMPDTGGYWSRGAKIPAGWFLNGDNDSRVLYSGGASVVVAEGEVMEYAISRDGSHIAWLAPDQKTIEVVTLTPAGIEWETPREVTEDGERPLVWAGEDVIVTATDSGHNVWTNWSPFAEGTPSSPWVDEPGRVLGVTAENLLLTTRVGTDGEAGEDCQTLRSPIADPDVTGSLACWSYERGFGPMSPDGRWLALGGSGFLGVDDVPQARPWVVRAGCGADDDPVTWVAPEAVVVELGGDELVRCTVDGQGTEPVARADLPGGIILTYYGP
ncbi:hypothetical protein AB0I28_00580 [Phytomonospora sp. NPDC050363]|uniref:hypothetical protein n=1 Tax=Phytomonospora sp. NPDC050363 TaxID=3155642 RepID=UPI0033E955C8